MHASFEDFVELSERLNTAAVRLAKMTPLVAKARQIREFCSDRRKRALAVAVQEVMQAEPNCSAAAAEHKARASLSYRETMLNLADEFTMAEQAIADHEARKVEWESARSLLSTHKAISGIQ